MSLFRFMSMAVAAIALAVLVVSNLNTTYPLVFLTFRTIPIPLGWLALGAFSIGVIASLLLRLLRTGARSPKVKPEKSDFSVATDPVLERPRTQRVPAEPEYEPEFYADEPRETRPRPSVYEANYRVIKPPPNAPQPKADSNLKPDSEDWGFDFDEND
jgi:uncharacterized integral membrane protein